MFASRRILLFAISYLNAICIYKVAQIFHMVRNYLYQLYRPDRPAMLVGTAPLSTVRTSACECTPVRILPFNCEGEYGREDRREERGAEQ